MTETIQEFELAGEERYWTGLELMTRGDGVTGIYLMGYAAEMLLKSAYFRFMKPQIGLQRITSKISGQMLRDAAREGVRLHIRHDPESFHSLLFWALLLTAMRKDQAQPLPPEDEDEMLIRTKELHRLWMIEHRYQNKDYGSADVARMYINVTWLLENHEKLWR